MTQELQYQRTLEDLAELFAGDLAPETKVRAAQLTVQNAIAGVFQSAPPPVFEPQFCKSCGADIQWMKTVAGKSAPFDTRRLVITTTEGRTVTGFESHFATCKSAREHRKDKTK